MAREFEARNIKVHTTSVKMNDDKTRNYIFTVELPISVTEDEVISISEYQSSIAPLA